MYIMTKGETVFQCDKCNRYTRQIMYENSINFLDVCNITQNCNGNLRPVTSQKVINKVPSLTPAVEGMEDWFQRQLLFTYEQTIGARVWEMTHDLGTVPILRVYIMDENSQLRETQDYVAQITNTTTTITFNIAQVGVAQLQALTHVDQELLQTHQTVVDDTSISNRMQVTTSGEITLATASHSPIYSLTLTYTDSLGNTFDVDYPAIDDNPSILSPWSSAKTVLINGKVLKVRSFSIYNTPNGTEFFESRQITGFQVKVGSDIANQPRNTNILLLTNAPYGVVDRDLTNIIDLSTINKINDGLILVNGEILRTKDSVVDLYPSKIVTL